MNIGDIISIQTKFGEKIGVIVGRRKLFMVGPVIDAMVDGAVITYTIEKVKPIKGDLK